MRASACAWVCVHVRMQALACKCLRTCVCRHARAGALGHVRARGRGHAYLKFTVMSVGQNALMLLSPLSEGDVL